MKRRKRRGKNEEIIQEGKKGAKSANMTVKESKLIF